MWNVPRNGARAHEKMKLSPGKIRGGIFVGGIMANYSKEHINKIIDEYVNFETCGTKADRNREILRRRLIDGILFEPLAEEFSISVRQCQNIVYKTRKIVFEHL